MVPEKIEVIARVVIFRRGNVLLCRTKGARWYFFPGGHVESRERAVATLRRELREELGMTVRSVRFIGVVENIYRVGRTTRHEVNLVFTATATMGRVWSKEEHIEFIWVPHATFRRAIIKPRTLHKNILRWQRGRKIFWASEEET